MKQKLVLKKPINVYDKYDEVSVEYVSQQDEIEVFQELQVYEKMRYKDRFVTDDRFYFE